MGAGCSALSLVELAEFAKARNAVVFLSVGGQVGRSGQLQQFLTEEGISFTGPGALPCMTCADRVSPAPSILVPEWPGQRGKTKACQALARVVSCRCWLGLGPSELGRRGPCRLFSWHAAPSGGPCLGPVPRHCAEFD